MDSRLPGAELIDQGVADLTAGLETIEALVVSIGAPRLIALGLAIPPGFDRPERRLYERLAAECGDAAHSRYNALIRRLVSFERAAECVTRQT